MTKCRTIIIATVIGCAATAAHAQPFLIEKVLDTDTLAPGGGGATFTSVDEPPSLSNGMVYVQMRASFGEIEVTDTVGGEPTEIIRVGGPMPDGISTISGFGSRGYDVSGSNIATSPRRSSNGNDTYFASLGGTLQLVAEANVTAIPDGSGDLFTGLSTSDVFPISGENVAFEGFGPNDKNGIYGRIGGTLTKFAQSGEASPNGSIYSGSFDEPSIDGQNVAFEARTHDYAVAGAFGIFDGAPFAAATTDTQVPGQSDNFTFLDNPQIDESAVLFYATSDSSGRGLYLVDVNPTVTAPTDVVELGDAVPGHLGQTFTGIREGSVSLGGDVVAFEAKFGSEEGIFAQYNDTLLNIVDSTGMLDGKAVRSVDFDSEGLDGNQVAFEVGFEDNSAGVYIATIPEPATLGLLSLGGLLLVRRRR